MRTVAAATGVRCTPVDRYRTVQEKYIFVVQCLKSGGCTIGLEKVCMLYFIIKIIWSIRKAQNEKNKTIIIKDDDP